MRSMTGFGQAAGEREGWRVHWTVRGVNHRHLDAVFRLGDEWRGLEPRFREVVRDRAARGRIELALKADRVEGGGARLVVDEERIAQLVDLERRFERLGWVSANLELGDLLRVPGAVTFEESESEDGLPVELALDVLAEALDRFDEARDSEGARLASILEEHCHRLGAVVDALARRREVVVSETATGLRERVAAVLDEWGRGVEADPDRLAQEVAILVDKSDVREELDRLGSHLEHLLETAARTDSIGKRLDFLAQEIFRELTTVGAKCRDAEMTRTMIDGKSVCEQIREQVQNVE